MGEIMDEVDQADELVPSKHDEALVRFVARQIVNGKSEKEIRQSLDQNRLFSSRAPPAEWRTLIRQAQQTADEIKWMVVAKAEMEDVEHQRLDSFARRKRAMARLEAVIESAHEQSDSVSKLNQVSFMIAGLIKAQESMDSFTGAKEAAPQVQINIGYDPQEQFREVIQKEIEIVDVEPIESNNDDDEIDRDHE